MILPSRILTGLRPAEIEAILAHELAHFARRDGWLHFVQIALETLFFYHPAAWWLGRSAAQEREKAADDLALELCGDRRVYAGALAQLAALQLEAAPVPAATGGRLLARIQRILQLPADTRRASRWSLGAPLLMAAFSVALLLGFGQELAQAVTSPGEMEPSVAPVPGRALLVHRLYLDLAGRPPTSEELEAALKNTAPDALAKLVEKLLSANGAPDLGKPAAEGRPLPAGAGGDLAEQLRTLQQSLEKTNRADLAENISKLREKWMASRAAQDKTKSWVADVLQTKDAALRERALRSVLAAMVGDVPEDQRAAVLAFNQLGAVEFDRASFRPALRGLLASPDAATRKAAAAAFTRTGAEPPSQEGGSDFGGGTKLAALGEKLRETQVNLKRLQAELARQQAVLQESQRRQVDVQGGTLELLLQHTKTSSLPALKQLLANPSISATTRDLMEKLVERLEAQVRENAKPAAPKPAPEPKQAQPRSAPDR